MRRSFLVVASSLLTVLLAQTPSQADPQQTKGKAAAISRILGGIIRMEPAKAPVCITAGNGLTVSAIQGCIYCAKVEFGLKPGTYPAVIVEPVAVPNTAQAANCKVEYVTPVGKAEYANITCVDVSPPQLQLHVSLIAIAGQ